MKKRLLAALLTCVMLFSLLPATALAEDLEDPQGSVESSESITVDSEKDEVEGESYKTIQSAINYITKQQQEKSTETTNWVVDVQAGTYNRFLVPHGVSNITIQGQEDETVITTLDGSELDQDVDTHTSDGQGIIIWGANITLKDMKITSSTETKETNGVWYASAVGSQDGMWGSSAEANSPIILDNITFEGDGKGFAFMPQRSAFAVRNCSINNYAQAIYFANDNYSADNCVITGNTITNCVYAIHGYYGKGEAQNAMKISYNTISGTQGRFAVIAVLDQNNTGAVKLDISRNTFSYTIVGGINQPAGTMESVMGTNTMKDYSYVADAYWHDPTDYGTTFYAPKQEGKIATWYGNPTSEAGDATQEELVKALNEYGTAGQVIEINAPAQEMFTIAKNAIVIKEYVDAGDLKITKTVLGNPGIKTAFTFNVRLTRDEEGNPPLHGRYDYIDASGNTRQVKLSEDGTFSVTLKAGESVTIKDLLPGTSYTITEKVPADYSSENYQASGSIVANATQTASFVNTYTGSEVEPTVDISKTATQLDANDTTDVTLTVGAGSSKENVAVMFVLDKSTSTDVRKAAADMLNVLASKTNTNILYDVVVFSGTASSTGWQDISDTTGLDDILNQFVNPTGTSGTNLSAGLYKANQDIETLVKKYGTSYETYLITLSDGITYVWTDEDTGTTMSAPIWEIADGGLNPKYDAGTTTSWDILYDIGWGISGTPGPEPDTAMATFMSRIGAKIAALEANYKDGIMSYDEANSKTPPAGITSDALNSLLASIDCLKVNINKPSDWKELRETYPCSAEIAIYYAAHYYQNLLGKVDHSYAFAVPELKNIKLPYDANTNPVNDQNWKNFPWGEQLMVYLADQSSNKDWADKHIYNDNPAAVFNSISDEILYEIQSGTITDVIGADFDLTDQDAIGENTFTLTANGITYAATAAGNTVSFGTPDENSVYPFVLTYYQGTVAKNRVGDTYTITSGGKTCTYTPCDTESEVNGSKSDEFFVLQINVPVKSLELGYKLTLTSKQTASGNYTVPTNETAVLEYQPTNSDKEYSLEYDEPTVSYEFYNKAALVISKTVTNGGSTSKDFTFNITMKTPDGSPLTGSYGYTGSSNGTITFDADGKASILLHSGQTISINRLPVGTTYTVEEVAVDNYTAAITGNDAAMAGTISGNKASGTIVSESAATLLYTNTYTKPSTPSGGSSGGGSTVLNTDDHYSYIIGYKDGYLRPYGTITRGEVATIFFRLLTDEARDKYWSQTNNYSDCNSDLWCNNAISTLSNMGIIDGYTDGTFRPYGKITRAQFAKIAVGFFETTKKEYQGYYSDVPENAWFTDYVEAASRVGLIQGFEDGTFRPNTNITRAQACVIVNRALNRKPDEDHLLPEKQMVTWPDNNPGDWYYADMQEATNSHDYTWLRKGSEKKYMEDWTKKLEQRDWAAFEHAWSTAHSAPGGEVVK